MSTIVEAKAKQNGGVEVAWTPRRHVPTGIAVAALVSAAAGMLTLAVVNVFTFASPAFNGWVHSVGKLWMPGAAGIGPYSGKETLAAVAWLASWVILHYALRERELDLSRWVIAFLTAVGLATTLIWPPVFEYLGHLIKG
jgi:hypothetical protein